MHDVCALIMCACMCVNWDWKTGLTFDLIVLTFDLKLLNYHTIISTPHKHTNTEKDRQREERKKHYPTKLNTSHEAMKAA